jgi:hypothetical protein
VDVTSVEVSRDNFVSDITVLESPLPDVGSFTDRTFDLSAFSDDLIKVRFTFDTVDDNANHFEGFYVDDVAVGGVGPPVCGNGLAAPACSGTGEGGSIDITVSGVPLNVPTFAGDSSITVASRVAQAINDDPTLQGMGVSAVYSVSRVDVIGGTIDSVTSNDPGITIAEEVPALPHTAWMWLAPFLWTLFPGRSRRGAPAPR